MSRNLLPVHLRLGGEEVDIVDNFQYLGSILSSDNTIHQEISNRIQKASNFYRAVHQLLWDETFPQASKISLYRMYLQPILTFGLEAATLTGPANSRLQATEMKFLRSCLQKTRMDKIRNVDIRQQLGLERSLLETLEFKRLRWYGHMRRMAPHRIPQVYFNKSVPGKRPRGRPRDIWVKQIHKDLEVRDTNWHQIHEQKLWMDRNNWRRLLYPACWSEEMMMMI